PQRNLTTKRLMSPLSEELCNPAQGAVEEMPPPGFGRAPEPAAAIRPLPTTVPRPAWIEIDLQQLQKNFQLIHHAKPEGVQLLSVVKDEGYGHGALPVAKAALAHGATFLALSTVEEAVRLRQQGIRAPLLLLGDRQETELDWCIAHDLTCSLSEPHSI